MAMKVLVLADGMGPPDARGIEIIFEIIEKIAEKGIEIRLLTTLDHFREPKAFWTWVGEQNAKGIKISVIDLSWLSKRNRYIALVVSKALTFAKAIQLVIVEKPDIIHEYSSTPILFLRTFIISFIGRAKSVHTLITYSDKFWSKPYWAIFGNLLNVVIIPSEIFSRKFSKYLKREKIKIISQGVDLNKFLISKSNRKLFGIPANKKIVLYLGPPEKGKGLDLMLEVVPKFLADETLYFLFVFHRKLYDKEYETQLTKIRGLFDKHKKSFKIIQSVVDVPTLLRSIDVVVLPQINHHGTLVYPQTLLEAMATGNSVVVSKSPEISEIVSSQNGFLFKTGDANDLTRALSDALSSGVNIGKNAQEEMRNNHSVDNGTISLYEVYNKLL